MRDIKNMTNESGKAGESRPSSKPPGKEADRSRNPSKKPGRPKPIGKPHVDRGTEGQAGIGDQGVQEGQEEHGHEDGRVASREANRAKSGAAPRR